MKTSLVCTVLNEEKTVNSFLESVFNQSKLPDEIIITDGGSTDNTISEISSFIFPQRKNVPNIKLLFKNGNRSVGRNEAIKKSTGDIILISDAGCVLDKNWVKNILAPFVDKKIDVVAGYYKGAPKNIFEKCLVPYVLVMPDKINKNDFLPATRSMALRKSVWEKLKGFDEKLSHNEDYAFASKIKEKGFKIAFSKSAIVHWSPPKNIIKSFKMFFRFALGDAEAKLFRDKVIFIFLRYIFTAYLFVLGLVMRSYLLWLFYILLISSYLVWSIAKNYRYVKDLKAIFYLPLLQITSDFAVMSGTLTGLFKSLSFHKCYNLILKNRGITILITIYILIILSVINWGIPNLNHPFTYHMDEWHFSQALRTFLKFGSGSVSGAASIPLFHIVSSLIFLVPFYLLKIVDPLLIKSSLDNLLMQHAFFEILRVHTLFYGALTAIGIYLISKKFLKFHPIVVTTVFVFTPLWIFLSNFYKYDITLNFWIVATIFFLFKYNQTQKLSNFLYAGITCALALSTKFTAGPLLVMYLISYFILSSKISLKHWLTSAIMVIFIFCSVGIPDMLLGKGSYYELLHSTLIQAPKTSEIYYLGLPSPLYIFIKELPAMFGYFLTSLTYISFSYWTLISLKTLVVTRKISQYKIELCLCLGFVAYLSTSLFFGINSGGNRALVLLPFMILLSASFIKHIIKKISINSKYFLYAFLLVGIILQMIQVYAWQSVEYSPDPRVVSSAWIVKNLPKGSTIGLENIPIYQMLPDVILKEFYLKDRDSHAATNFNYKVISASEKLLPKIVIITDDFDNVNYLSDSPKKELINMLQVKQYKKVITFSPNMKYFNIFSNDLMFILLFPTPRTISIYEK